jgi:hypothetical protein
MHISKPVLLGLGILGAILVGWMLHMNAAIASAGDPDAVTQPGMQQPLLPAVSDEPPQVQITIVTPDDGRASVPGASATEPIVVSQGPSRPPWPDVPNSAAAEAGTRGVVDSHTAAPTAAVGSVQVDGLSVIANGNDIVIATDGAIISVGDNTVVHGNTGDATASGTIGIDVTDSDVTSGNSGMPVPSTTTAPPAEDSEEPEDPEDLEASEAPSAVPAASAVGNLATRSATDAPATRATAIAGYDVRSIDVNGNENLLTYEDSNLFFHRVGNLNGNTGDTDTSGLNVVDATRSTVQSGNSWATVEMPVTITPTRSGVLQLPTNGASASVADGNGVATATGDDTLVIGGRGVDDRGVSVYGNRNAVTYDDGNAAIGGTGDVNSQIGDSANGGTVAMRVVDSTIVAGDALASSPAAGSA